MASQLDNNTVSTLKPSTITVSSQQLEDDGSTNECKNMLSSTKNDNYPQSNVFTNVTTNLPKDNNSDSSKRIFLGGLGESTSEYDLEVYFSQFGPVYDVRIVTDRFTGRSKCYGFVTFYDNHSAQRLLRKTNVVINGNSIRVRKAYRRTGGQFNPIKITDKNNLTANSQGTTTINIDVEDSGNYSTTSDSQFFSPYHVASFSNSTFISHDDYSILETSMQNLNLNPSSSSSCPTHVISNCPTIPIPLYPTAIPVLPSLPPTTAFIPTPYPYIPLQRFFFYPKTHLHSHNSSNHTMKKNPQYKTTTMND